MGNSLVKSVRPVKGGSGVVPAVCSAIIPGVGQLVNGETDKAIGVFVVAAGAGALHHVPLVGAFAGLVFVGTWLYGVADGYIHGRKRR
jgi:TM2 domain-containing membrane protein YozV